MGERDAVPLHIELLEHGQERADLLQIRVPVNLVVQQHRYHGAGRDLRVPGEPLWDERPVHWRYG